MAVQFARSLALSLIRCIAAVVSPPSPTMSANKNANFARAHCKQTSQAAHNTKMYKNQNLRMHCHRNVCACVCALCSVWVATPIWFCYIFVWNSEQIMREPRAHYMQIAIMTQHWTDICGRMAIDRNECTGRLQWSAYAEGWNRFNVAHDNAAPDEFRQLTIIILSFVGWLASNKTIALFSHVDLLSGSLVQVAKSFRATKFGRGTRRERKTNQRKSNTHHIIALRHTILSVRALREGEKQTQILIIQLDAVHRI